MGVYSTVNISRSKAREVLIDKLFGRISDEELESFMDIYLEPKLFNCRIVEDNLDNDNSLI